MEEMKEKKEKECSQPSRLLRVSESCKEELSDCVLSDRQRSKVSAISLPNSSLEMQHVSPKSSRHCFKSCPPSPKTWEMAYVRDVLVGMVYVDPFYNTGQYGWHFLGTEAVN